MERTYKKNEIVGTSDKSFGEAADDSVAQAGESLRPINWLAMAEQCMILSRLLAHERGNLNGTNLQEN
jgi:flavin-binding protein dodecin